MAKAKINLLGLNVWICSPKTEVFRSKYLSKSKGHILCVLYCFFFFISRIQCNDQLLTPKLCAPFSSTWLGLVHIGRWHLLTQPLQNIFSSVTKPLQSWPLWPSWQLWAQICRSSWRLRIGSNVCKRCSLSFDNILFFFSTVVEHHHPLLGSAIFRKIPALLKQWTPKLNKIYSSSRHNGVNNCVIVWCYTQALYVLVPGFWCHIPVVDDWMLLLMAKICTQHQKICTKH